MALASTAAIAAFGKRLQCPICLNVCASPVTLPCSHFFCRDCINRHKEANNAAHHASTLQFRQPKRKAGEFDCPVCRLPCNHRQTTKDDTLEAVTSLFRQLRQLVEDESGMLLSQDVPLHTHSIPPPNNSPPRSLHAAASSAAAGGRKRVSGCDCCHIEPPAISTSQQWRCLTTLTVLCVMVLYRLQRTRSPVTVSFTERQRRRRPTRRTAAPSIPVEEEDEQEDEEEEQEEEEEGEEEEEEEEEDELDERKEEALTANGASETSESSQKENMDPLHQTEAAASSGKGKGGRPRRSRQRGEDVMAVDGSTDDVPLLDDERTADGGSAVPVTSSLFSLSRPRTRAPAARLTPNLFAPRHAPSTPTYARSTNHGFSTPLSSTPSKAISTLVSFVSSGKAQPATSSPQHIQRATFMSIRRKPTTCTLLTSHLDDEQVALVKELEALINHHATTPPTVQHPRVVVTSTWSPAVTHLVTSASTATASLVTKRTNKYFLAMLSPQVAIVTIDWVTDSIVSRRLVDGAKFRVKGDSRHPTGGEARQHWLERADDQQRLLTGWQVSELGQWSNKVVRDDVRAIMEVGGGHWLGSDDQADGAADKRYVLFDDGKRVVADNRALLSEEVVRSYEERGISVVPCSWLFDCVSSFSLLPTPPPQQQAMQS